MSTTPTAPATVHPSCPPNYICDTPDGAGMKAAGIFAVVAILVLLLAAAKRSGR